jgi:hypothetical protein
MNTTDMSDNFYWTPRPNIPEQSHLHCRRRENPKSHTSSPCLKFHKQQMQIILGCYHNGLFQIIFNRAAKEEYF